MGGAERNPGLDLLRILSMFFIVVLHLLGVGGVLGNTAPFSWGFLGAWLLEAGALCAVNCYGLLSGYFGATANFRYQKFLPHWFQVAFYSVGFAVLYAVLRPGPGAVSGVLKSFFPVLTSQYWYFTAYAGLFFLMPFLNMILRQVTETQSKQLVWTLVLLFSVLPSLFNLDPFRVHFGYSLLWLVALYLLGGCLGKYGVRRLLPTAGYLGVYLGAVLLAWGGMLVYSARSLDSTGVLPVGDPFLQYMSPFILLAGTALFLFCKQLRLKNRGVLALIRFFAPVSFGVYLIHANPVVWTHLLTGIMTPLLALPAPAYLGLVLLIALGIYLACSLIDALRLRLFRLIANHMPKRKG